MPPKFSVFTPTNNAGHLLDVYQSLLQQSVQDFEWILVVNGGLRRSDLPAFNDPRVVICDAPEEAEGKVGALKRFACSLATGEILVELDHDDQLLPAALAKVGEAFAADPDVGMVFSNCGYVQSDNSPYPFRADYGWQYRERRFFGFRVMETISPAPVPQHLCKILFAPDHLRAYRKNVYDAIGGHDAGLQFADDHDLTCRMYLRSKIQHIDDLLYIYRVHGENNWLKNGELINELQWQVYEKYVEAMALKWVGEFGYPAAVNLGCGTDRRPGYLNADIRAELEPDRCFDLNRKWPWADNQLGVIRAVDVIEHVNDPVHFMNEAWYVLVHGGFLFIEVPSTDGRGAFQDPTHKSFWNSNSFWYYTRQSHQQYVPEIRARFQVLQIKNYFPNQFCEQHNIVYTRAHLIAIKDGQRFHGEYGF